MTALIPFRHGLLAAIVAVAMSAFSLPAVSAPERLFAPEQSHADFIDADLAGRLQAKGFQPGTPVFIRIFKASSELEVWLMRGGRFHRFETYKICKWAGDVGPKLEEGDKQSPEGVYTISTSDLRVNRRWHRAMDMNFPNAYDRTQGRTGSGILIHGKCSSVGCFAMTDGNVEEIYALTAAALDAGQARVVVHALPFPLTQENLARESASEWRDFWQNLRPAYTHFERDRLPPKALVCGDRYRFFPARKPRGIAAETPAGCLPLNSEVETMAARSRLRTASAAADASVDDMTPAERAKTCDPRKLQCRMLRIALFSKATCPRKYARCRSAQTALIKSVDCPLKYPRCRRRGVNRLVSLAKSEKTPRQDNAKRR